MPETVAQSNSTAPASRARKLVKRLSERRMGKADSTLRDINDEEEGEEIANPDVLEYKRSMRG